MVRRSAHGPHHRQTSEIDPAKAADGSRGLLPSVSDRFAPSRAGRHVRDSTRASDAVDAASCWTLQGRLIPGFRVSRSGAVVGGWRSR